MANYFEKYGIKEVADVTFYKIERKNETLETQRTIELSSILKSAIKLQDVYPLENGVGGDEGFQAYVFEDAEILTGTNYVCDDEVVTTTAEFSEYTPAAGDSTPPTAAQIIAGGAIDADLTALGITAVDVTANQADSTIAADLGGETYSGTISFSYTSNGGAGTHEYSYEDQVLMLFAKKQNLIKKSGVRYQFENNNLFGNFTFSDEFASAPSSTEKVAVLIFSGRDTANTYDAEEVITEINNLTTYYKCKAYSIVYKNYAELAVEDEMGYYNPNFLGTAFTESAGIYTISGAYSSLTDKDVAISNATMWGADEHASINDAIDALKAQRRVLDQGTEESTTGIAGLTGGYTVNPITTGGAPNNTTDTAGVYSYVADGATLSTTSKYALSAVLDALAELSIDEDAIGEQITVTSNGTVSNRAIYVDAANSVDTDASAYIYLLRNKDYKKLSLDTNGLFTFKDNKGNTCYYKDTIFAGTEYLALVIIGTKGLIFTVGRNGTRKIEKLAWMVNESGYLTDKQCANVVDNGLIHTIDITIEDETFEATCAVSGMTVRKTVKSVLKYTPVLFLDTLKVSTIEQTAEQASATGGKGNAQLIIWDYGKEITLTLQDALYSPASMSAMLGSYSGNDFTNGIKKTTKLDRMEKCTAKRSFIVPAGNSGGVPSEGESTAQAVYIDPTTMQPYQDGAPIAEGETFLKWTRSIAYDDNSLGNTIEISAEKFPGTYKVTGDTCVRNKVTGDDERFMFIIPQAKMSTEQTITLEADGDPTVFDMTLTVLRPDDGIMMKMVQYDVVENTEENDGSTMVKGTENLNLLDDAEMFHINGDGSTDDSYIGATEY